MTESITLSLVGYKPMLVNEAYRKPFYRRAEHDKIWGDHFSALAEVEGVQPMEACTIEVQHVHGRGHRGKLPDTGSCYPAVKAAVDGLVVAGVLPGDGPAVVRSIVQHGAKWGDEDAVHLTLHPVDVCTDGTSTQPAKETR